LIYAFPSMPALARELALVFLLPFPPVNPVPNPQSHPNHTKQTTSSAREMCRFDTFNLLS
jgi:hypothetical protein